ncbi:MAG: RluA family pseudouridine synthase [Cyanobacteria bacterium]|nr:RluA family pseudouridine synthase [Cyanobacteriota bacterium]MDA0866477.1 RluA family pseudouridine synthase [Cyanobacteriota bacterium]
MNQGWTYHNRVQPQDQGLSLLAYYTQRYPHSSQAEWRSRILAGAVLVDGAIAPPDLPLQLKQRLSYYRRPWQEPPAPLGIPILYEDADLLVVAKPSGLPVLPGGGFLEHTLLHQLQQRYPQDKPVPVHRLGRGTSGVMLLGRSPLAKADLSRQLREATERAETSPAFKKIYRALVAPGPIPDRFTLTTPIGRLPHDTLGYVYGASPEGKPAYSQGHVLERRADSTLVEVAIATGRPHQIRIHMAAAGYPLVGDPLYGVGGIPLIFPAGQRQSLPGDCGYHLHAYELYFCHPRTAEPMTVQCPAPDLFCVQATRMDAAAICKD